MKDIERDDLKYIWHPCTQMKDYEKMPPIVIEKGEGCYLYDVNGNSYLDCISSWWTNIFGHSNKRINKAIEKQLNEIEHVIFAHFSNKPAVEFSKSLIKIAPEGLDKIFFSDNGSSAVEIALKMSFQYYQQTGKVKKTKFAALTNAYHGETIGALSVGDLDLYSKIYKPLLIDTLRIQGPDCYRCKYNKERHSCEAECFEEMEKSLKKHNSELCAIIIEPMIQGAAGMKMYSPKYLKKLRYACDYYDISLIFDEIAVGFGRTGKMFACENADISPDIMCLSKGISAGYMPMSVVLTTSKIYNAFYDDYVNLKAFIHSHTYAGNALACAAAIESLKIFKEESIIEKNIGKSKLIEKLTKNRARNNKFIGDIRSLGMVTAIELVKDKNTKESFDWKSRVGYGIYKIALKKGLLLRPIGDVLYFMPPYSIGEKDIEFMVEKCFESIEQYLE
ncbi:adenosylmethionine-8-amino-7-oxononanoate aminotransferase [Clostridium acetobutylicum]|nr:adenosylmethionine-8-amino-7-oxononanoate aminotransferase [Clostridium acetobutylicum]